MNTATYILSVSTKREAIVFLLHNSKAGKQSFSAYTVFVNQVEEILPRNALIDQSYASNFALYIIPEPTARSEVY